MTTTDDPFDQEPSEAVPGGQVEVIAGKPVLPTSDAFETMLAATHSQALEDPDAAARAITERILNATTIEEILGQPEVRHARDLLDVPVLVNAVHFNQSDFEEGPGFYAIVDVEDPDTGDTFAVSCGGRNVMAQLYALAKIDAFPAKVKITQARKPTRQGYWPLWLVEA